MVMEEGPGLWRADSWSLEERGRSSHHHIVESLEELQVASQQYGV